MYNLKMENPNPLPRFDKCCFVFGLRCGVLIFVSIEALLWAILSFAAVYSEVKYINDIDLLTFSDSLDYDWYYYLIFERSRDYQGTLVNERTRSMFSKKKMIISNYFNYLFPANLIVINLVLSLVFILYLIFTLLLLIGISKVRAIKRNFKAD